MKQKQVKERGGWTKRSTSYRERVHKNTKTNQARNILSRFILIANIWNPTLTSGSSTVIPSLGKNEFHKLYRYRKFDESNPYSTQGSSLLDYRSGKNKPFIEI